MVTRVDFSDEAKIDLLGINDWYEFQKHNLGQEFHNELSILISKISSNPLHYKIISKHYRKATTQRFPYNIFYKVDDDKIIVVAILHQKRHPSIWKKRL